MFQTGVALALCLGLVGTIGNGVAAAKGDKKGGNSVIAHGRHLGSGGTDGGSATDDTDPGSSPPTSGTTGHGGSVPDNNKVGAGAVTHGKKGGKKGGPESLAGTTTCSVHGKVSFMPALMGGGTATSTVTITGLLNRCGNAHHGKAKFNNGHLTDLVGTLSANDCAMLTSGVAPAVSGGSIKWTPPSKAAESSGVSLPAGTGSVVTRGAKSVIQISYSGGSVASGSFTNTGGVSVKVTSDQDTTQISARCTTGLTSVAFTGTATV